MRQPGREAVGGKRKSHSVTLSSSCLPRRNSNNTILPSLSPHSPSRCGQDLENSLVRSLSLNPGFNQSATADLLGEEKPRFPSFLRFETYLYSFYTLIGILRKEMMRIGNWAIPFLWKPGRQSAWQIKGTCLGSRSTHSPQLPSLAACGRVFTFYNNSSWKRDESCT